MTKNIYKNNNKNNSNVQRFGKGSNVIQQKSNIRSAPTAVSKGLRSNEMRNRIHEKERFINVGGHPGFGLSVSTGCNPGIPQSFPWLSTIASNYDKYVFHKLIYRYRTLKGTTNPGNIIIAFDYDTQDLAPGDAVAMTQLGSYADGAVWDVFEMNVPCDGAERYIRGTSVGGDKKMYDLGRFFASAEACSDSSDQGYLEVEYDVSLLYKNNSVSKFGSSILSWFTGNNTVPLVGITDIVPWERAPNHNGIGVTNGVFSVPKGNWLVTCTLHVSGISIATPSARFQFAAAANAAAGIPPVYLDFPCPGVVGSGTGTMQFILYSYGSGSDLSVINVGFAGCYMPGEYRSITFQPI